MQSFREKTSPKAVLLKGSIAQLVQSVCLTSRGSGVRLPLLPPPGRANQSKILKSGDFGIFCFIPSATVLRTGPALSFLEQALLCRSEFYSVLNEAPLLSSWNATIVCQHKRSRRRSEGSGAPLRVSSPTDGPRTSTFCNPLRHNVMQNNLVRGPPRKSRDREQSIFVTDYISIRYKFSLFAVRQAANGDGWLQLLHCTHPWRYAQG